MKQLITRWCPRQGKEVTAERDVKPMYYDRSIGPRFEDGSLAPYAQPMCHPARHGLTGAEQQHLITWDTQRERFTPVLAPPRPVAIPIPAPSVVEIAFAGALERENDWRKNWPRRMQERPSLAPFWPKPKQEPSGDTWVMPVPVRGFGDNLSDERLQNHETSEVQR